MNSNKKMTNCFEGVLPIITGSSGLIGSEIANEFIKREINFIGIDILKSNISSSYYTHIEEKYFSEKMFNKVEKFMERKNTNSISCIHLAGIDSKYSKNSKDLKNKLGYDIDQNFEQMIEINLKQTVKFAKKMIELCNLHNLKLNLILTPSLYSFVAPDPLLYNKFDITNTQNQKSISYVITKSSIPSLARYLTATYGFQNHRFNCFVPHGIMTSPDPSFVESFIKKSPMRRLPKAKEIIGPCLFLLSNDSSYMNGQSLIIDGGWSCI